jgi:YebC/PmpR family DNA-binding regulatory protein
MSGHSKWNNIKRTKGKVDAQRGKIFTKIGREIAVAVKNGGADLTTNNKLFDVVQKAKQNNMPSDTITRSIKKAAGELGDVNYEEITYEGYGPGGSAVLVECLTDNKNRTAGDIRHIFERQGAGLGSTNSVSYLFNRKGVIVIEKTPELNGDTLFEKALDAGADDVQDDEDAYEVITNPTDFANVKKQLETDGYTFLSAEVEFVPTMELELDAQTLEKFEGFIDALEDLDDVQNVYHNVKME